MATVPASEIQKNFGEWHDRSMREPVEITKYGRTSAFLVSAPLFKAMWDSFRQAIPTEALTQEELEMIMKAQIADDDAYDLDDLPEIESNDHKA